MQVKGLKVIQLVIDARMYFSSGIGTVLQNLIPRLSTTGFSITLLLKEEDLNKVSIPHAKVIPMKSSIYSIQEQIELCRKIPKTDLFWSPHYNIPLLPIRAKKRFVTIHDVCHLALKDCFSPLQRFYAKRMLKQAISRSDLVLVNSQFTVDEIKAYLKKEESKIKKIHFAVDKHQFASDPLPIDAEAQKVLTLPKSYFLFVGNLKPHKNLSLLLEAFEQVADNIASDLVIVGAKENFIVADQAAEKRAQTSKHRNRIHFLGKVEQKYLPSIYRLSKALVFPSLYEGFGFPALEAMQCSSIVIASKIGALKEVCEDAALYFDPQDSKSLEKLLIEVDGNEEIRRDLLERSKGRLTHFNWDETASRYATEMRGLLRR